MKKYLRYHWLSRGIRQLETSTGQVTAAPGATEAQCDMGAVFRRRGKDYAFHHDDRGWMLQQGSRIWRVRPGTRIRLKQWLLLRNFSITESGRKTLSTWYGSLSPLLSLFDPTYDRIDAEADDFFLYVKNQWRYWCDRSSGELQEAVMQYREMVKADPNSNRSVSPHSRSDL